MSVVLSIPELVDQLNSAFSILNNVRSSLISISSSSSSSSSSTLMPTQDQILTEQPVLKTPMSSENVSEQPVLETPMSSENVSEQPVLETPMSSETLPEAVPISSETLPEAVPISSETLPEAAPISSDNVSDAVLISSDNISGPIASYNMSGANIACTDESVYIPPSRVVISSIDRPAVLRSVREAILNRPPVEPKLHVIIVISNPCLYQRRYDLAREFVERMKTQPDVVLYIVEIAYENQAFAITDATNRNHLQLHAPTPLWHKENMINLGVEQLLPTDWKAMAWIDADIEFENVTWASDTLKILNGSHDIVQLFSHAVDMDHLGQGMSVFNSFGYQYAKGHPYVNTGINYWHPGFAWACTREAYDKMGGLYEVSILGSGDNIMALSLIGHGEKALNEVSNSVYKKTVREYQDRVHDLRLGYVPGVILHHYHGTKKNRKYSERWKILIKYDFSPILHLARLSSGVLAPTADCPVGLLDDIMTYFTERNEDDFFSLLQ